jgi:hypothetical protein
MNETEYVYKCSVCGYKNILKDMIRSHIGSKKHKLCREAYCIMADNKERCMYCNNMVKPYGYYKSEHLGSCKLNQ